MWEDFFFEYVCPSLGCLMSAAMYAAPVSELRRSLVNGKLGALNPVPWAIMTGNAVGWCAYAYYAWDPFVLASNIPGLVVSIWLNMGAAKLQYLQIRETHAEQLENADDATNDSKQKEAFVFVPQETALLRILVVWSLILVLVGWVGVADGEEREIIGILANINVVFFYGAPLQTMQKVIEDKSSESIHVPTMVMNLFNTSFWISYGLARNDHIIYLPNTIGFFLGAIQALLCALYPVRIDPDVDGDPLIQEMHGEGDESEVPALADDFPGVLL